MDNLLLGDVIRSSRARVGNRPAVTHQDRTLTYEEVADQAEHIAAVLAKRSISRGARVVWWGNTTVDAVPLFFGLAHLGAVFVPINPAFSPAEATSVIGRADPALVLVDDAHEGELTLSEVLGTPRPSVVDTEMVDERDPHIIYFTSGTTGLPKGVVLSHRTDMLRGWQKLSRQWPLGPSVNMFPQFHMAGWTLPLSSWMAGEEVIYVERGEAEALLAAVERHHAYRLYCIPAVWRRILEADPGRFDTSSLREADTGTSATSPDLIRGLRETFPGATTSIVYGSTESGSVTLLWPQDLERKPGSVGLPSPGVYVTLSDEGEILVRSTQLMTEYFRDPEATEKAMSGGWYHTGELGEVDDEGYYSIIGRAKDIIRTGGETVAPVEVDLVLQAHPAVADAAVAGVPNDDWGEVVTAFIVPRPGQSLDLRTVRSYCTGKLAAYKHPRHVEIVESIPRTPSTGQAQRRLLVEISVARSLARSASDEPRFGSAAQKQESAT
jgi:fatty-acyl-CoA synthase